MKIVKDDQSKKLIRYKKCLPLYEIKGHYESLSNTDTFLEMALEHDLELGV